MPLYAAEITHFEKLDNFCQSLIPVWREFVLNLEANVEQESMTNVHKSKRRTIAHEDSDVYSVTG